MTSLTLRRTLQLAPALAIAVVASLVALPSLSADAGPSSSLVLAEVYGGGGNSGATYTNDFIELRNIGGSTIDVGSYSVQYASSSGSSWQVTALSGSIPAGGAYLIQEASGGTTGAPMPDPDAIGSINMSGTSGKVALVSSTTALSCGTTCHGAAGVIDFVGYGAANDFEGSGPAPTQSSIKSDYRPAGFADSDDNAADFAAGTPAPNNCADTGTCSVAQESTVAEVQGAAQISPLKGQAVTGVTGIITAVKSNGVWIQDPRGADAPGYVPGASSGVFVFTGSAPGSSLVPGTAVSVDANVGEFRPGAQGLTITELTSPVVTITATSQPLPAPTVVGAGGLAEPTNVIDSGGTPEDPINVETEGVFDPDHDGIDFWESLEGMRVEIDDARATGPTDTGYGETPIVPAGAGTQTARGGILLQPDDPNPERVILDDALGTFVPAADTGDMYAGPTIGILDYDFNNFHLHATQSPTLVSGGIQREVASPGAGDELSAATFNVENLDPGDPAAQFNSLAQIIVNNLQAPDLLALEEIQDNNGAVDNGVVDADITLQRLVDAITSAGGPTYTWQQINPVNDQEGGEPGGNIRVAFLVQAGTPLSFVERDRGDSVTPTHVTQIDGQAALTHSPGRVDPGNAAWAATRVPLAGEFLFGGQKVFVVVNHWSSKGGDDPLFGPVQPPQQASESKRTQQAAAVGGFVDEITAVDPDANVMVMGDLNDFDYSQSVTTLTDDGSRLLDLPGTLPDEERYTYVFEGNSQVLDHIALSPGLVAQGYDYDVVHVNAEFSDQVSDHDPQLVDLHLGLPQADITAQASESRIKEGTTVTLAGTLTDASSGEPLAGETVTLAARTAGSSKFVKVGSATTGDDGGYEITPPAPEHNTRYRVTFAGNATYDRAVSPTASVQVASRVRVKVSPRSVKAGGKVLFTGIVAPSDPGGSVEIQALVDGTWTTIKTVTLDADSFYSYRWTAGPDKGTFVFRVVKPRDALNAAGFSPRVSVTVH